MSPKNYHEYITKVLLDEKRFMKLRFSGKSKLQSTQWQEVILRPIFLKEKRYIQFSYFDKQKNITKNYIGHSVEINLNKLFDMSFKNIHIFTTDENIHIQQTKKGKIIIHHHRHDLPLPLPSFAHDRPKNLILPEGKPDPFLKKIGVMTKAGHVRATMRDKFRQINAFLNIIQETHAIEKLTNFPLHVIDCGCGNAHLTFAVYHYLNHVLQRPTKIIGIDRKADLLEKRNEHAKQLGWTGLTFEQADIIEYQPIQSPDIVLALHACDTATDEALAQAINWDSRMIFSVPCCHHHLQAQFIHDNRQTKKVFKNLSCLATKALLRHGILRERLGDILTDTFRSLILQKHGYQTNVIEFISSEHTAKNIMIRAVKTSPSPNPLRSLGGQMGGNSKRGEEEYEALKSIWQVTPYLEELL